MAERACDLMMAVEERLQALERAARETDAAQWVRVCSAEGWPVALVAYRELDPRERAIRAQRVQCAHDPKASPP